MRTTPGAAVFAAASLFLSSASAVIDPIVIKGSKFFYENNGTQFFIKGVAYQQDFSGSAPGVGADTSGGFTDPLANPSACKRDVQYLKELETNTIRVYAIDPTKNHDDCMSTFADAGIYVVADLSAPNNGDSINRDSPTWDVNLYARYASVVDVMAKYENTLGFFAGNEVANAPNNTNSAPFVKAAVRDMKSYIKQQGYRTIGVGYATSDNSYIRVDLAEFFNCGDPADAIDFWGYNIYSWCGDSTYQESGYAARTAEFESYSVPAFFAEYGCNTVQPRPFTEVLALYGPQMSKVFSGGIVYLYFQEANDYGLVTIGSNNQATTNADFTNLKTQIAKVSPATTNSADYTPTNSPAACPTEGGGFNAESTPLPPTPNEQLCECMYNALSCVVDSSTSSSKYKSLFNYVCGHDNAACKGFQHDSVSGSYGAYSMCSPQQQLGWAFNAYYKTHNSASTACDFNGAAKLQSAGSVSDKCKSLLSQAGSGGQGTVTAQPSGTGSSSSSSSSGAAGSVDIPKVDRGLLPMAFVVALAGISGMAVIFL